MSNNTQHEADAAEVVRALRDYQHGDGHCEIVVKVQNGCVVMIETTHKRKPPRVGEQKA